jgi:lysophospholipid acyltransferase (LPLAT)-like uncharacterized protein
MTSHSFISSLKTVCVGTLAAAVLGTLARSIRWSCDVPASVRNVTQSAIIVFWHDQLLMMPRLYWMLRGRRRAPTYMLISQHGDGRIIASAVRLLGIRSVAGSSTRGGLRALLELIRLARDGSDIGFTPDGPRGPRHEVKEGVVLAAAKTGSPIILCAYSTEKKWQLRSWDRMIIPKPFSRGIFLVGEPIVISEEDDPEVSRQTIQSALHELTKRADEYWSAA